MSHTPVGDEMTELAALHAVGALDPEEARAFERHVAEGCDACAEELREFESVAALLARSAPPVEPPASVREKLLSRAAEDRRGRHAAGKPSDAPSQFVGASEFLVVRKSEGEWAETSDPGVFVKLLFVDKERDTVTTLVRIEPGARIPAHRHLGVEQCLVLEGDMRAGAAVLHAGDFNCAMPDTIHEEIYSETGALLLIVAPESYEVLGRVGEGLPQL